MLSREAAYTNFIVYGLTSTRWGHAIYYTTDYQLLATTFFIKYFPTNLKIQEVVGHRGHDHMVVSITTTYVNSAYHHLSREFESHSWWSDKVCQRLTTGQWFSPGTPVSSTNKTDYYDTVKEIRKLKSQDSRTSECLRFTDTNRISLVRQKKSENCSAILDNYEIENPREVREITSEWLLITGSLTILCVTPTPYQ